MKILFASMLFVACVMSNAFSHETPNTLDQIKQTGKIRIGFRVSEPPMSFLNKEGKPIGYSIDLCNRIVAGLKIEIGKEVSVEYIPVTAHNRFDALVENKIDILCGSTTKTLSRSKRVDFTQLTFVTGASLMTLKEEKLDELSALDGKKVGVVRDTTTLVTLKNMLKETLTDTEVVTFNTAPEGLDALRKGEIAAFSSDQVVLIGLVITAEDADNFALSSQVFSYEPFAFAVRRNDADFRLVADSVLSRLYRTGRVDQTYSKWFGKFSKERPPLHDVLYKLNATPE
jgi:ABC-type amino acid transport substrate-binding protein